MKKQAKNKRDSVSVLGGLIILGAVLGCALIAEYGTKEEIQIPEIYYTPPSQATIPNLYDPENGSDSDPSVDTLQPADPNLTDRNEDGVIDEADLLPREKYDLPYPQTERPEDVKAMIVQHSARSGYEYFDNSVFLGDSVTLGLKNYATKKRQTDSYFLGDAKFIAVGSYSVADTLVPLESPNSIHSLYNGERMQPQDIIARMGVKKVFICLGLNDVGIYTQKEYLTNYSILINRIRKEVEDVQIAILSVTPLTLEGERKTLYNERIDRYNNVLAAFAKEYGCYFIDVSQVLKNEEGYLADELSSDNYCHLEPTAYDAWIDYMLTHCIPTPEEEAAIADGNQGPLHIDKGIPEVEGWEGSAGEP